MCGYVRTPGGLAGHRVPAGDIRARARICERARIWQKAFRVFSDDVQFPFADRLFDFPLSGCALLQQLDDGLASQHLKG